MQRSEIGKEFGMLLVKKDGQYSWKTYSNSKEESKKRKAVKGSFMSLLGNGKEFGFYSFILDDTRMGVDRKWKTCFRFSK